LAISGSPTESPTSEPTPGVTGLPTVWDPPVFPPSPTAEPTPGVTGLPTVWDPVFPSPRALNCYDDHTCPLNILGRPARNVDADGSTRTPCNSSPCTDAKCCTVVQLPVCVHEDCEHWDCPMWCACFDGNVPRDFFFFFFFFFFSSIWILH
jgi:hypothetical protein